MRRLAVNAALVTTVAACPGQAMGAAWPQLEGEQGRECQDALRLARTAFDSNLDDFAVPDIAPVGMSSVPVLQEAGADGSDDNAIKASDAEFTKVPWEDGKPFWRSVYWQNEPALGYRLVVRQSPGGYFGDTYTLYHIDPALQSRDWIRRMNADPHAQPVLAALHTGLRPPKLYKRPGDGAVWAIIDGDSWQYYDDWKVHLPAAGGLRHGCTIRFRSPGARAEDQLPAAVRKLERLLDRTMGSGANEGRLQHTSRLRNQVQLVWANAALRPWVSHTPYNSRDVVDGELKRWANISPYNRRLLHAIARQYPIAQHALAGYYQHQHGLDHARAQRQSAYHLDVAFRSHYVFSGGAMGAKRAAPANPWTQ